MADAYTPYPVAANGDFVIGVPGSQIILGGFLCTTAGNLTLIRNSTPPINVIEQIPVARGQFYGVPMVLDGPHTLHLAGGARGTVLTR